MRIKSLFLTFAAAALFVFPAATHAAPNSVVGRYDTSGLAASASARDVIVVGHYAYVAVNKFGIAVLDVTDPAAPTLAGSYTTGVSDAWKIDIDGTRLYVAGNTSTTLTVLSIANPTVPTLLSAYTDAGGMVINNVTSSGSIIYITGLQNGVETVKALNVSNISTLTPPTQVGASIPVHDYADMVVSGDYVYIVGGKTLDIINTYPTMTLAGTYTSPDKTASYMGVQVFGSVAYLSSASTGLTSVAISDPSAPTLINNYPGTYGGGIAISNGYIFLGHYFSGDISIYDIASVGSPVYVTDILGSGNGFGLTIANAYGYITEGSAGIAIMDVSKPDTVAPTVTPLGDTTPTIAPGATYVDPGVTVDDNVGGTGTEVTGAVDTAKVGTYTLTYTVTDRAGNISVVTRTVTVSPSVEKVSMNKNNTFTLKVGKKNVTLTPFSGYHGAVLARRMIVNTKTDPFYVFIATDAMRKPELVMYNASGKQVTRYNLTSIGTKGLQLEIVPNPKTQSVFIAVAPKTNGLTAVILNVSKSGFKSLKTVTAAKGTGTLVMKWLKGYTNEYILATLVKGKTATPYVWRYSSAKSSFVRDLIFDTSRMSWTTTSVKLK